MMDECGYCGGETDTGMNCIAGCQNVIPARVVYKGRAKPMPIDDLGCARCEARDKLFEEMEAEIRFSFYNCPRKTALLTKLDALQKGEA